MQRPTRAPTIFGGILMLAGSVLYFIDSTDESRRLGMFVVPAMILMGLGALFAVLGTTQQTAIE
ncbi:MAG: hypothetical protein ABI867_37490 [Kofleriaceae bacterium]